MNATAFTTQPAQLGAERSIHRRTFLRQAAAVSLSPLALGSLGSLLLSPPARAQVTVVIPARARGTTVLNVRDFGAVGDGVHDDTAAIQATINKLPLTGGTVQIPAGTYLIDTIKSIKLRSLMLLQLDPAAVLKAKTSSKAVAKILYLYNIHDVEVAGGALLGERDTHVYASGGTDEWNHGIQLRTAQRVTVRDVHVANCTGDGMLVGYNSADVVIANVVSTNNRRQGLSITWCNNVRVFNSEFSYTNGTKPQCGIDVEPGSRGNSDIVIQSCRLNNNAKYGINVWRNTKNISVNQCTIEFNSSIGMSVTGCNGFTAFANTIRNNQATGVFYASGTANVVHSGNLSYANYARQGIISRVPFTYTGYDKAKLQRDILIQTGTTNIAIQTNSYQ